MISSSPIYLLCLVLVFLDDSNRVKVCSIACMLHIVLENSLNNYMHRHILSFDFGLYLNILWCLDLTLILSCLVILSGVRKKLIVSFCGFVVLLQIVFLQYPYLNETLSSLLIEQAYYVFIESFILISAVKFDSIKDIIKSSTLIFLIMLVHLLY